MEEYLNSALRGFGIDLHGELKGIFLHTELAWEREEVGNYSSNN